MTFVFVTYSWRHAHWINYTAFARWQHGLYAKVHNCRLMRSEIMRIGRSMKQNDCENKKVLSGHKDIFWKIYHPSVPNFNLIQKSLTISPHRANAWRYPLISPQIWPIFVVFCSFWPVFLIFVLKFLKSIRNPAQEGSHNSCQISCKSVER